MWMCKATILLAGAAILVVTAHAQQVEERSSRKEFVGGFGGPPLGENGFFGGNPLPRPQGLWDLGDIDLSSPDGIFEDHNYSFNQLDHITDSTSIPSSSTTIDKKKPSPSPVVRPRGQQTNLNYIKDTQTYKPRIKYTQRPTYRQQPVYNRPDSTSIPSSSTTIDKKKPSPVNYIKDTKTYKPRIKYTQRPAYRQQPVYNRPGKDTPLSILQTPESRYKQYGGVSRPARPHHQPAVRNPRPSASAKKRPSASVKTRPSVSAKTRTSVSAKTARGWVRPGPRIQQQRYRPSQINNRPKYQISRIKRRRPVRGSIG